MGYLLAAFFIGFAAGLRSLTPPAMVSWGAYLGWLRLQGSSFAFMASGVTVAIFSALAVAELVADKLPRTPDRTRPGPLMARILLGALAGACLSVSGGMPVPAGAAAGGLGGGVGAFIGYEVRRRLVSQAGMKDRLVAVMEDLVALGLAYALVRAAASPG